MAIGGNKFLDGTLLASLPYDQGQAHFLKLPRDEHWLCRDCYSSFNLPWRLSLKPRLGQRHTQNHNMHDFLIDLLDIVKEVAIASWPFPFSSKSGLLAQGNSSIGSSMQVVVTSAAPFLYIPSPLAKQLRNTYVYITTPISASNFGIPPTPITTPSPAPPACLYFAFRLNASITETITINVPFSL